MTARKVQLKDSLGRVIRINPEATEGAVIGVNLFWPDGTIATASQIANSVTTVTVGGVISQSSVAWGSVLGKPSAFPSAWGQISGVLGDQSDLQAALDAKAAVSHTHPLSDLLQSGAADGDVPTWNAAQSQWLASAPSPFLAAVETVADTVRDMLAADVGKYLVATASTGKTWTVQPDATIAMPVDAEIAIENEGAADLTLVAGSGVTITAPKGGTLILEAGDVAVLKRKAADVWKLAGGSKAA